MTDGDSGSDRSTGDSGSDRSAGNPNTDRGPFDPADIEAVCFDLDDTLFDFTQYIRQGLSNAAEYVEAHTGEAVQEELLSLYFDEDVRDRTFDELIERRGLDVSVDALVEAYHDSTGSLEPFEEVEPVLTRLGREYALGLVTDGRNGREKLRRLGVDGYFDHLVVAHDHGLAKRDDPQPFERVLDALGVDPEATLFVGDHPAADLRVPARLGMRTVRLRRGRYVDEDSTVQPDVEIDSLAALPGLCGVVGDE